ncbi:MAG: biotin transporter BioY [Bacteroidales bacterium]|nr:biotin transporter BioY [Bacteroidales bacterium]
MKLKDLIKTSLFVVLMIVGAFINVSFGSPIPYTLQTLFVLMSGIVLGVKYGPLSQVVYILLGLFGLPIFTQGRGGFGALMSPTFGFLLGFILGAYITALLFRKLKIKNSYVRGVLSAILGAAVIYIPGILYFYVLQNAIIGKAMSLLTISGFMVPFFIPDLMKAVVAGLLGVLIRQALLNRQLVELEKIDG